MTAHHVVTLATAMQDQLVTSGRVMTVRHAATSVTATQDQPVMTARHVVTSTIVHLAAILVTATRAVTTALLATTHVNAALTMQEARPQTRRPSSKTRF